MKSFWVGVCLVLAILVFFFIVYFQRRSLEKTPCYKQMVDQAEALRSELTRGTMDGYEDVHFQLEEIASCRMVLKNNNLDPEITLDEFLGWVKAAGIKDMKDARNAVWYFYPSGPDPYLYAVQNAHETYDLGYAVFGTTKEEMEDLQHQWAKKELAARVKNLMEARPNGYLPSLNDFNAAFNNADKFRKDHGLNWEDGYTSEIYLQYLQGKFYAARADLLKENLRFYNIPLGDWRYKSPRHYAEAIYVAEDQKGFCDCVFPTHAEVERLVRLAYARLAEQFLDDLRAKKYAFPDSLKKVDELKKILKEGNIDPEELGTSEWEMKDLSRENPLGKVVGD